MQPPKDPSFIKLPYMNSYYVTPNKPSGVKLIQNKEKKKLKKFFKPFSHIPCMSKKAKTLERGITGFLLLLISISIIGIVLGMIPLYRNLIDTSERKNTFSIDIEDAFRQNDQNLFRITSTTPQSRNSEDNKIFTNFLNDLQNQLNAKTKLKLPNNVDRISAIRVDPKDNTTISISFKVFTKPITNNESVELKKQLLTLMSRSEFYNDIQFTKFATTSLPVKGVNLVQEPLLVSAKSISETPDFIVNPKQKFLKAKETSANKIFAAPIVNVDSNDALARVKPNDGKNDLVVDIMSLSSNEDGNTVLKGNKPAGAAIVKPVITPIKTAVTPVTPIIAAKPVLTDEKQIPASEIKPVVGVSDKKQQQQETENDNKKLVTELSTPIVVVTPVVASENSIVEKEKISVESSVFNELPLFDKIVKHSEIGANSLEEVVETTLETESLDKNNEIETIEQSKPILVDLNDESEVDDNNILVITLTTFKPPVEKTVTFTKDTSESFTANHKNPVFPEDEYYKPLQRPQYQSHQYAPSNNYYMNYNQQKPYGGYGYRQQNTYGYRRPYYNAIGRRINAGRNMIAQDPLQNGLNMIVNNNESKGDIKSKRPNRENIIKRPKSEIDFVINGKKFLIKSKPRSQMISSSNSSDSSKDIQPRGRPVIWNNRNIDNARAFYQAFENLLNEKN